jgi:hypothetical protein
MINDLVADIPNARSGLRLFFLGRSVSRLSTEAEALRQ